jgi:hypothetical protein
MGMTTTPTIPASVGAHCGVPGGGWSTNTPPPPPAAVAGDAEAFDPDPLLKIGGQQMLFGANRYSDRLPCGTWLIWDKRTPTGSKGVMSDAEVAWWSKGRGVYLYTHTWDGFNRASERFTPLHPTQKPVALMRWCLQRARLTPPVRWYLTRTWAAAPSRRRAKSWATATLGSNW